MTTKETDNKEFLNSLLARNPKEIARYITMLENGDDKVLPIRNAVFAKEPTARVIGVTGAPGVGKSTLVDKLAMHLSEQGKTVAVVAIDPSSPFSGGAILGDRIRMQSASLRENVFVRSLATRGALGGLSRASFDVIQSLSKVGFDYVLIETVGVGQAEVDIAKFCETTLVVLIPGMGDGVQALKAGILEIADVFVLNKADREGIDRLEKDLLMLMALEEGEAPWEVPLCRTVATKGEGLSELVAATEKHRAWLLETPEGAERTKRRYREALRNLILGQFERELRKNREEIDAAALKCLTGDQDLASVAEELFPRITNA